MQNLNGKIMSADIPVATIKDGVVVDKNDKLSPLFLIDVMMLLLG